MAGTFLMQMPNMDPAGLLNSILTSVERIDNSRYGLKTNGKEYKGRLSYENVTEHPPDTGSEYD